MHRSSTTYEVWYETPDGRQAPVNGRRLAYAVAAGYAREWNRRPRSSVPAGSQFFVMRVTETETRSRVKITDAKGF